MIANPKQDRIKDRKYLDSFRDTPCECCGLNDGTTVPAHFSIGSYAKGLKAGDDLVAGLCFSCHALADNARMDNRLWVWTRVLENRVNIADDDMIVDMLRAVLPLRYKEWKADE